MAKEKKTQNTAVDMDAIFNRCFPLGEPGNPIKVFPVGLHKNWSINGVWDPDRKTTIKVPRGWDLVPAKHNRLIKGIKTKECYWEYWGTDGSGDTFLGVFTARTTIKSEMAVDREQRKLTDQLEQEIYKFLNFTPEHDSLARSIARDAFGAATDPCLDPSDLFWIKHLNLSPPDAVDKIAGLLDTEQMAAILAKTHIMGKYTNQAEYGEKYHGKSGKKLVDQLCSAEMELFLNTHRSPQGGDNITQNTRKLEKHHE